MRYKARLVSGVNFVDYLEYIKTSTTIHDFSVILLMLISAINDLILMDSGIVNTFTKALNMENYG